MSDKHVLIHDIREYLYDKFEPEMPMYEFDFSGWRYKCHKDKCTVLAEAIIDYIENGTPLEIDRSIPQDTGPR